MGTNLNKQIQIQTHPALQRDIVGAGDVVLHVFGGEEVEQTEQHASKEKQPVDATVALAYAVAEKKSTKKEVK